MKLKTYIYKRKISNATVDIDYRLNRKNTSKTNDNDAVDSDNAKNAIMPLTTFWSGNNEICFVSDDQQIYKWSAETRDSVEVAKLPDDFRTTDMHWLLVGGGGGETSLLLSSNDGRCVILNKSFRPERSINAHNASISSGRWSPDATGLLTGGEDGVIKIWSRSGMLRSTVVQSDEPVRCARWAPNSAAIVFSQGSHISIKPLAANSKLIRWRAHEAFVLSLSWSTKSNIIASGGEDFRFKIWDTQGANLYTSAAEEYAITAVEFNADTDLLIVGSFNMLKLCSNDGWTYSTTRFAEEPTIGSVLNMSWSPDGTQIACGTSTGNLIVGYVVDRQMISRNLKATTTSKKTLLLEDITNASKDILEFPERIINFGIGYGHLIVASAHQLHIYNENSINTPIIVDGRNDVRVIEVRKKFFMVLDATSIWVYTYTGRLHLNPRYPGLPAQITMISGRGLTLGLDVLGIRDNADNSVLHIFDLIPGASRQYEPHTIRTKTHIDEIAACRAGTVNDQFLVFIDHSRELYITETRNLSGSTGDHDSANKIFKIGTQVIAVMWGSEANILVGLHDACYSVWYCPGEGAVDPTIIALTTVTIDTTEFGKNVAIESFEEAIVTFRCSGALLPVNVNIYCEILHRTVMDGQWQQALKICRYARNPTLWATLAAIATRKNQFQISEEAYCAALQIDKVCYLQHIKQLKPSSPDQMAENSLMMGRLTEAETILLHNRKYGDAIALCLRMHQWRRALEIAQQHQPDMTQTIFDQRRKYLKALDCDEWDEYFLSASAKIHHND